MASIRLSRTRSELKLSCPIKTSINAFNQAQNPHYDYTRRDIIHISSHILKQELDQEKALLTVVEGQNLQAILVPFKEEFSRKPRATSIMMLSLNSQDWIVLCLCMQGLTVQALYKDSPGLLGQSHRDKMQKMISNELRDTEFKVNCNQEQQTENQLCSGVLALQNMKFMVEQISNNKERFLHDFETLHFPSQDGANELRKTDFPIRFKESVVQHIALEEAIKRHHHQECHRLANKLEDDQYATIVLHNEGDLSGILDRETKTLVIEITVPPKITKQYAYYYHIVATPDLDLKSTKSLDLISKRLGISQEKILQCADNSIEINPSNLSFKCEEFSMNTLTIRSWPQELFKKIKIFLTLLPSTPSQFYKITNIDTDNELSNLLQAAIEHHSNVLAKYVLKAGMNVEKSYACRNEKIDFRALLQTERNKAPLSASLEKIDKIMNKYGFTSELIKAKSDELRIINYEKILDSLSFNDPKTKTFLKEFSEGLKMRLKSLIIGLFSIASGKIKFDEEEEGFEIILMTAVEYLLSQIPTIGEILAGGIKIVKTNYIIEKVRQKIGTTFNDPDMTNYLVDGYAFDVIQYKTGEILHTINSNQQKRQIEKYAKKFLKRIADEEAKGLNPIELGAYISKKLSKDRTIHEQDLCHIGKGRTKWNGKAMAKLLAFVDEMQCVQGVFQSWDSIKNIYELTKPQQVTSVILISQEKVIITFSSQKKIKFEDFYEKSKYARQKGAKNEEYGLSNIIQTYRDMPIYIAGNNFGVDIAVNLLEEKLINLYKLDKDKISLYLFGEKVSNDGADFSQKMDAKKYLKINLCGKTQIRKNNDDNSIIRKKSRLFTWVDGKKRPRQDLKEACFPIMCLSTILKQESSYVKYCLETFLASLQLKGIFINPFEVAAEVGNLGICELLLSTKQEKYPLHYAAKASNIVLCQYLIKEEKITNYNELIESQEVYEGLRDHFMPKDTSNYTSLKAPLHFAIENENLQLVKYLVGGVGVDINLQSKHHAPPFCFPKYESPTVSTSVDVSYSDEQAGFYAVPRGLLREIPINMGYDIAPLGLAASTGNLGLIKYLLKKGAEINKNKSWTSLLPPLHIAVVYGHINVAKYLIERGANINLEDSNKFTALHYAAFQGDTEIIKLLINERANLNAVTHHQSTPLHWAAYGLNLKAFKILVDSGADTERKNKSGAKPIDVIISMKNAKPEFNLYYLIYRLRKKELNYEAYVQSIIDLLQQGIDFYSIVTYFISECIRLENEFSQKYCRILREELKKEEQDLLKYLSQFITGKKDVHDYSLCIKLLLSYGYGLEKQEKISTICSQHRHAHFKSLQNLVNPRMRAISSTEDSYKIILNDLLGKARNAELTFEEYKQKIESCNLESHDLFCFTTDFIRECNTIFSGLDVLNRNFVAKYLNIELMTGEDELKKYTLACKEFINKQTDKALRICSSHPNTIKLNLLKDIISSLSKSPLDCYMRAEELYREKNYFRALSLYRNITLGNNHFYHAQCREVSILMSIDSKNEAQAILQKLSKKILPIDIESDLHDIKDRLDTTNFASNYSQQDLTSATFDQTLQEALIVDPEVAFRKLKDQVLKKPIAQRLTDQCREIFKEFKYAHKFVITFSGSASYSGRDHFIRKEHPLFQKLNTLVEKLTGLKETSKRFLTREETFQNSEADEKIYYQLFDSLIGYYEWYINAIIEDYNENGCNEKYIKDFDRDKARLLDVKEDIKVRSEDGNDYLLKNAACKEITLEESENSQYGAHKARVFPRDKYHQVYYKLWPYAPGLEFAVSSFYNLIINKLIPETKVLRLTSGRNSKIYQASEGVFGRNFADVINQPEIVLKIDMRNFSGLFISSLLTKPGEAKPDNFVVKFNYDQGILKSTELIPIDNDIPFCPDHLQGPNHLLNILYLMPQADKPISPFIREHLLCQTPEVLIARWLASLHLKNQKYEAADFKEIYQPKTFLYVQLPVHTARKIYSQLRKIVFMLQSEATTHSKIFKMIYPNVSSLYEKHRDSTSMRTSLKNSYATACMNLDQICNLYDSDKNLSPKARTALSSQVTHSENEFHKIYSESITKEAHDFLGFIDFSDARLTVGVVDKIGRELSFLTDITLRNISFNQLETFVQNITTKPQITLIDPVDGTKCQGWLREKQIKFKIEFSKESPGSKQQSVASEPFMDFTLPSVESATDLLTLSKYIDKGLTKDSLMKKIVLTKWNINQVDNNGKTLLHHAVSLSDNQARKNVAKLLLDCGINSQIRNNQGQTALDICISSDLDTALLIISHRPDYLWQLLDERRLAEVEILARSVSPDLLESFYDVQKEKVMPDSSLLEVCLKDPKLEQLALVLIDRIEGTLYPHLALLCVQNYPDSALGLLEAIVVKCGRGSQHQSAADYAYEIGKFEMLTYLINAESGLSHPGDDNVKIILKASKWEFIIDSSDFKGTFDYTKTDRYKNNTIFHRMCMHKDIDILLRYKNVLRAHLDDTNVQGQTVKQLAEDCRFVECLEFIYKDVDPYDEDGQHALARDDTSKELSKILNSYNIKISVKESCEGISLDLPRDRKGNTALQILVKKYMSVRPEEVEQIKKDIKRLLNNDANISKTHRRDGNTSLHLAARYGDNNLISLLIENPQPDSLRQKNIQQQMAIEIAQIYGHSQAEKTIKSSMKPKASC